MEQEKIERINALARKSKEQGLTEEEQAEQKILRREYIDAVVSSLRSELNAIRIVDGNGNKRKLPRRRNT